MRRTGPHISRPCRRQPRVAPPDPALELSERRHRELADALPQPVFETDQRGVLTFANRAAFETFGYSEDDLARGPSVLEMLAPDERERAAANVRMRMAGERSGPSEYQMQRSDGTLFPAIVYVDVIERDGRVSGMRGIVADISARRAADERLRLTNARLGLLNSTSQALNAGAPLSDAVQGSCDGLRELFGYDYVELFLPAVDDGHVAAQATPGGFSLSGPLVGHSRRSRTFADARLVEFRGRDEILPLIVDLAPPGEREMLDLAPRIYEILGVQYVCQIPLLCAGEVVGHLAVGKREDAPLPDREKRFLEQFSEQLAVIIAKAHAEDRLRSSEQRYRALFNSGNDAVLLHDLPGSECPARILAVNDLTCEITGYSRDELLGMTIWDVQPPALDVDLTEIGRRLQQDGRALFETACLTRDGRRIPVEVNTHLLELDGRPVALSVARDVTERKRWEERLRRVNECFLSFGPDPRENIASLTDLCGEVLAADWTVYARRQGATMLPVAGWHVPEGVAPPEDISGCICEDVLGAAEDRVIAITDLQDSKYAARDPSVRDLGARSYLGRAVRLHDGTDGSVCAFFARDYAVTEADEQMMGIIAAAIRVEEERRQVRDQRERALADLKVLNRDLERARQEAEDANRIKSEFLANTSHEIRTPLNGIVGYLQLVLNGLTDSPEEEREFLTGAADSARRLLSLINDVLGVAKIEAGKLRIEPQAVNVAAALADLHSLVRVQADQAGITLVFRPVDEGLTAWCDAERLKQVLLNLLGNAVKFTPAGGSVTVSATARDDQGAIAFEVADTGIGIARDKLDAIFEKFVQADGSTTRARGGSGLGLTISRRLVELMGGTLTAHSAGEGRGSTFRFTVPVHRAPRHSAASPRTLRGRA